MHSINTSIPDVVVLVPKVFGDERGFFFESYNQRAFECLTGHAPIFVQDNHSLSAKGVLRGLHYQIREPQGKLLRVLSGEIFDVAVDMRRDSPTFGKWVGERLSAENRRQLWIPEGFAHGFLVLSEMAEVLYKTTRFYAPDFERILMWSDPVIGIDWPLNGLIPTLSKKDGAGTFFENAEVYEVGTCPAPKTSGNGKS